MTTLICALLLLQQEAGPQPGYSWSVQIGREALLRHDNLLQQLIEAREHPTVSVERSITPIPPQPSILPQSHGSLTAGDSGQSQVISSGIGGGPASPEIVALLKHQKDEADACLKLARRGNAAVASRRLKLDLVNEPDGVWYSTTLLDVLIADHNFKEAFMVASDLLAPYKGRAFYDRPETEMRVCLAGAELGRVYPGEREYCVDLLCYGSTTDERRSLLPKGNSPREIAGISATGIGNWAFLHGEIMQALPYVEIAHSLLPNDPLAAETLADCYTTPEGGCRYSAAVKALDEALPYSGTGPENLTIKELIDLYQKDEKRLGDGNPGNIVNSAETRKVHP